MGSSADYTPQNAFFFEEAPAVAETPIVRVPPTKSDLIHADAGTLKAAILRQLESMPDDVSTDEILTALGIPVFARTAWHSSRVLDVLLHPHTGQYTAYRTDTQQIRYRRRVSP